MNGRSSASDAVGSSSSSSSNNKNGKPAPDESRGYQLLVELSEGCSKHEAACHSRRKKRRRKDAPIPAGCRVVLDTLQTLLPKTETVRTPTDVHHLCGFYRNVLQGGFCPHAPYLLDDSREGTEIIPRVHRLVELLLSKPFWNHEVVDEIHVTIAQLLFSIPEVGMQAMLLDDLVGMAHELCDWVGGISTTTTTTTTDNNHWNGETIELVFLGQTVEASAGLNSEFILTLDSPVAARLLQGTILGILHHIVASKCASHSLMKLLDLDQYDELLGTLENVLGAQSTTGGRKKTANVFQRCKNWAAMLLLDVVLGFHADELPETDFRRVVRLLAMACKCSRLSPQNPTLGHHLASSLQHLLCNIPPLQGMSPLQSFRAGFGEAVSFLSDAMEWLPTSSPKSGQQFPLECGILRCLAEGMEIMQVLFSRQSIRRMIRQLEVNPILAELVVDVFRMLMKHRGSVDLDVLCSRAATMNLEGGEMSVSSGSKRKLAVGLDLDPSDSESGPPVCSTGLQLIEEEIPQLLVRAHHSSSWLTSLKVDKFKSKADEVALAAVTIASTIYILIGDSDLCSLVDSSTHRYIEQLIPGMIRFIERCIGKETSQAMNGPARYIQRVCYILQTSKSPLGRAVSPLQSVCSFFEDLLVRNIRQALPTGSLQNTWVEKLSHSPVLLNMPVSETPIVFVRFLSMISSDNSLQRHRIRLLQCFCAQKEPMDTDQSLSTLTWELLAAVDLRHANPVVRFLGFQAACWLFKSSPSRDLKCLLINATSVETAISLLRWMMETALWDADLVVREYCSKEIGCVIALVEEALVKKPMSGSFGSVEDVSVETTGAVSRFVDILDGVLVLLSGKSSTTAVCQRCIARSLLSFVQFTRDTAVSRTILQKVMRCVVSQIANGTSDSPLGFVAATNLYELSTFLRQNHQNNFLAEEKMVSSIVRNTLNAEEQENSKLHELLETRFRILAGLLSLIVRGSQEAFLFFDHTLPIILSQLVSEKNHRTMQLACGFRLYLSFCRTRNGASTRRDTDGLSGSSEKTNLILGDAGFWGQRFIRSTTWMKRLEDQTRDICLSPFFIERILPTVFVNSGRDELLFFVKTVLQNKVSLKTILTSREQLVLKGLVLGLTKADVLSDEAARALETAAIARNTETNTSTLRTRSSLVVCQNSRRASATEWVSSHFMYLLVNAVQHRWSIRSTKEKIHAVRCLLFILDFLKCDEAPKFIPQIMASVNAAISTPCDSESFDGEIESVHILRCLAVKVLSSLIKLVAQTNVSALGTNLTSFVVALIPVIDCDNHESDLKAYSNDTSAAAVKVLLWLTTGDVGKQLASFFKDIPFLPPFQALEPVRVSLKHFGVDFDNLDVLGTQVSLTTGRPRQSDTNSYTGDSVSTTTDVRRRLALRRRLEMLCPLIADENASVRRAVLDHLTSLLHGNQELFYALVEKEGSISLKNYVTVAQPRLKGSLRGTITGIVDTLLSQCVHETDKEAQILLARCFGQIGALGGHLLEDSKPPSNDANFEAYSWRLEQPPWQSRPARYELQLVTRDLVVALKAAQTSSEQHKIVYTIQQLLVLLDHNAPADPASEHDEVKPPMSEWLQGKLMEAGVFDIIGPFWFSEFQEESRFTAKRPPFFGKARNYYEWISNWTRYLVHSAHRALPSPWSQLFHACRTALRTQAGLGVSEFLLPLLILDIICLGSGEDRASVFTEFHDAMTFDGDSCSMRISDRQKTVNVLFAVIDTFTHWSESEVEKKHGRKRSSVPRTVERQQREVNGENWPVDDSILGIEDFLKEVPLVLQARAAFSVGMYARSLRLLEMASRETVTEGMYNLGNDCVVKCTSAGNCPLPELDLMQDVLAALGNYETVAVLSSRASTGPRVRVFDSIRIKEASGNWEGALQDYERAHQVNVGEHCTQLQCGTLRCLLELGQLESTLNQVKGYIQSTGVLGNEKCTPFATEAAWRLGRWEELSELLSVSNDGVSAPGERYKLQLGRIMLNLHSRNASNALASVQEARSSVMESLASAGREGYGRAYTNIVNLQILSEIEDCVPLICSRGNVVSIGSLHGATQVWQKRLEFMSSAGIPAVMNSRLAMSRLAGDTALEGGLLLNVGRRARKSKALNIAENSLAQAQSVIESIGKSPNNEYLGYDLHMELAKLKYVSGDSTEALHMLGETNLDSLLEVDESERRKAVVARAKLLSCGGEGAHHPEESIIVDFFVQAALQSTQWMVDGGLKGAGEIMTRFRTINKVAPTSEKGHFLFAKYVDSVLQSRVAALRKRGQKELVGCDEDSQIKSVVAKDQACHKYVLMVMQHYVKALCIDSQHVYQALPRLLSLWFEFTSGTPESNTHDEEAKLMKSKEDVNMFMGQNYKNVPAQAFYTAMPQLISRVTHDDKNTSTVVKGILKRVLTKFPSQSLWPLAWLLHSKATERKRIGEAIFKEAQKTLQKATHQSHFKMLVAAKNLFRFFNELASYTPKEKSAQHFNVKPWVGEVELSEFLPPILAALAITPDSTEGGFAKDPFPRQVPRMRAFAQRVGVMSSKARPKKLKAFVIAADSRLDRRTAKASNSPVDDIGELHFLVKQEAKGDLRKDARVQDLNNVINRLVTASSHSQRNGKRLHLRTFVVTCLSEDTGILEWVPNTTSLRSLISKAYNPQASSFSPRRRGARLVALGDPTLRNTFETKCQGLYFKQGSLKKAAALFEKLLLEAYPPLLYWWFIQKYHDPHSWYEARTRFTLSVAAWSAVGHVIGLGDRHAENILVDVQSGACVHVDFDCIFDKGLYLPRPEVVPFRLTANMVDAFGPTGVDGVFRQSLKSSMTVLRENRDTLLSVLEPFLKDPVIDWRRYRSHQKNAWKDSDAGSTQDRRAMESKRFMRVIDERLQGIYNLRNPNYKRVRRSDVFVDEQEEELAQLLPLSVDGQVHKLIDEATSSSNLVQLYVGWMPWV